MERSVDNQSPTSLLVSMYCRCIDFAAIPRSNLPLYRVSHVSIQISVGSATFPAIVLAVKILTADLIGIRTGQARRIAVKSGKAILINVPSDVPMESAVVSVALLAQDSEGFEAFCSGARTLSLSASSEPKQITVGLNTLAGQPVAECVIASKVKLVDADVASYLWDNATSRFEAGGTNTFNPLGGAAICIPTASTSDAVETTSKQSSREHHGLCEIQPRALAFYNGRAQLAGFEAIRKEPADFGEETTINYVNNHLGPKLASALAFSRPAEPITPHRVASELQSTPTDLLAGKMPAASPDQTSVIEKLQENREEGIRKVTQLPATTALHSPAIPSIETGVLRQSTFMGRAEKARLAAEQHAKRLQRVTLRHLAAPNGVEPSAE